MKKLIILLIPFFFIYCSNPAQVQDKETENHNVLITLQNISSSNLYNVEVAGKTIGILRANSFSNPIGFDSFGFDTGMVDEDVSITINGVEINNHERNFWCGTEKVQADSGKYTIKIDISDSRIILYCDNPPYIDFGRP